MTIRIDCTQEEWNELLDKGTKRYISTKDRFYVEDCIQQVETTVQDIDTLIERYVDRPDPLSEDEMWNYLEGIKCVLKLRVDALWNAHRQREHIDGYGTFDEVMAQRHMKLAEETKLPDFPVPKKKGKKK